MIYIILIVIAITLLLILRWIFTPYFNWKKQKQLQHNKSDKIEVFFKNTITNYFSFVNPSDTDISIIIPAYNEEKRLGYTLEQTMKHFNKYDYEIIIVNDASKDSTLEVAKKYANDKYKIIDYKINKGKGGAVRLGMLIASGRVHLMMDADLATDLNEFEKCYNELEKLEKNDLGLVAGSRNHLVKNVVVQRKWYRNFLMYASNFVINQICGVKLKDTQCGFKLFTKNTSKILFRILHLERWAFDVELFMIANHYKVPVADLPVNWKDVEGSHLNVIEASITMARDFLLVRLLYLLRIWRYSDDIGLKTK